jgi:hypothetical protein
VTLHKEQWLRLLDMTDEIREFIAENEARLRREGLTAHADAHGYWSFNFTNFVFS